MKPSLLDRLRFRRGRDARREAVDRLLPGPLTGRPRRAARALLEGTLRTPGFPDVELDDGQMAWDDLDHLARAHRRQLHGHAVLRDLVHAHRRSGKAEFLDGAIAFVAGWIAQNPFGGAPDRMAWHDETTAMRVQCWLLLLQDLEELQHPWWHDLRRSLAEHAARLADDSFHTTGTNHGMFQDEALLTYTCVVPDDPSAPAYLSLAARRLLSYFDEIVTSDGVHREHAPAYHLLVAGKVGRLAEFFADARQRRMAWRLRQLHARMAHYATHVVLPDGRLPLVSDTFEDARVPKKMFEDAHYQWAVSGGQRGTRPEERNVVFPDAGYAVFRDRWAPDGAGTYVHLAAAYHTSYHKHSDDLSVWLYHDGDLLTEAGPNGYDYADPYTQYGFSSYAHNTLLVDGEGLPRVDDRTGDVGLVAWDADVDVPWARGRNDRFDGVSHVREVRHDQPAATVVVHDTLRTDDDRRCTLLWNCAPGVEPTIAETEVRLHRDGVHVATLALSASAPLTVSRVHGDIERRRGFRLGGGAPVPTWVVEVELTASGEVDLTHHITLLPPG